MNIYSSGIKQLKNRQNEKPKNKQWMDRDIKLRIEHYENFSEVFQEKSHILTVNKDMSINGDSFDIKTEKFNVGYLNKDYIATQAKKYRKTYSRNLNIYNRMLNKNQYN